jgi:hypothetical protein
MICCKCVSSGHHGSQCQNELVCRACKKTGHKRGDPLYDLVDNASDSRPSQQSDADSDTGAGACAPPLTPADAGSPKKATQGEKAGHATRPTARQSTLRASFELRSRSESTKRRRSRDRDSSRQSVDKQQRTDRARPNESLEGERGLSGNTDSSTSSWG